MRWFEEVRLVHGFLLCCFFAVLFAGLLNLFKDCFSEEIFGIITNVSIALAASIFVSFLWNKVIFDATKHYKKSGILDYFDDFSKVEQKLKKEFRNCKNIEIFFMYGSTFLNSNSSLIKEALAKKNNVITFMLADKENPFLKSYQNYWEYPPGRFEELIDTTVTNLIKWHQDIPSHERAQLFIYKYTKGCFTYSYYKIDDKIYFVPNKAFSEKTFKPITVFARKTTDSNCLYQRVTREKDAMISTNELSQIYPT
ncbi:hypothetical protein QUG64_03775 [Acinetobacter lwoffii]|uniref:hypothetical protein n=2 Tax=Moraxellaceae TaxID=468 RepID=UPI000314C76C|nr:hypothetical protein [Acinetobacter lwoffii]